MLFLSSLDNLLLKMHIIFGNNVIIIIIKGVDSFDIEHKTWQFLVRGVVPP